MFAGSGCIGIAILKHVPWAKVDFAEKEKKFLQQIKISAKLNRIGSKRYRIIHSNIFSNIHGKYDFILANPPYVAESKRNKVQKSVIVNEPQGAVFGGADGLDVIKKFLKQANDFLRPGGIMYMEFDSPQKQKIAQLLKRLNYSHAEFFKDQYGKWRYVKMSGRV